MLIIIIIKCLPTWWDYMHEGFSNREKRLSVLPLLNLLYITPVSKLA